MEMDESDISRGINLSTLPSRLIESERAGERTTKARINYLVFLYLFYLQLTTLYFAISNYVYEYYNSEGKIKEKVDIKGKRGG